MENYQVIEFEQNGEVVEHIIIDRGNGEFTSMPKAIWDELQTQNKTTLGGN